MIKESRLLYRKVTCFDSHEYNKREIILSFNFVKACYIHHDIEYILFCFMARAYATFIYGYRSLVESYSVEIHLT